MTTWLKRLLSFERQPAAAVAPGLYHAVQQAGDAFGRFHLRVEHDGSGLLIANAAATAKLTSTGTVIAKALLDGKSEDEALAALKAVFRGAEDATMQADINKVQSMIRQMIAPEDMYPVFSMSEVSASPYKAELIAPFQATVPVTEPEKMAQLLGKLWEAGVPHVTLLMDAETAADNAIRAVERAEDLGMIAGVRGTATLLNNPAFLNDLMQAGVDYITYIYASTDAAIHDALIGEGDHAAANALLAWLEEQQLCAVAEIPLVPATLDTLEESVDALLAGGADNLSFVAYTTTDAAIAEQHGTFTASAMPQVALTVEDAASEVQALFMWNPPVEFYVAQETLQAHVLAGPRCSGEVSIRVEENSSVIPPQGAYASAGNLITDAWENIWAHEAFTVYRESMDAPKDDDLGLATSSIEAPDDPATWARPEEA